MQPTIPAPLAAAFAEKVTISAAELCRLVPMDDATLRRHVRAGHIGYRRIGFGVSAPRRFTLDDVMGFLEGRSERECPSTSQRSPRSTPTTSGADGSGIRALRARLIAERQRRG